MDKSIGSPERPPKEGAEAVCFLWHWPSVSLYAHVPDVIRHTALRSSDFPLPATPAFTEISGSDRPVLLPDTSLPRNRCVPERRGLRSAGHRPARQQKHINHLHRSALRSHPLTTGEIPFLPGHD
ncbi:hypothetical protein SBA5_110108 [Candidatus Sulfotelmatomonas gaucii]|uniref:Uncharacterized protein n=1 Tax=Candidatus Sulfuritelmatomonas gaucii TaxID=2043161 RepID=A0A2N9L389_9BACT|nr:hypothetical protein SBA5_110108 [Candidatus Sulfotelmatomonas gaucii]